VDEPEAENARLSLCQAEELEHNSRMKSLRLRDAAVAASFWVENRVILP
jgi:hypothetical protein